MSLNDILNREDIPNDIRDELSTLYFDRTNDLESLKEKLKAILKENIELKDTNLKQQSFINHLPVVTWRTSKNRGTNYISSNVESVSGYTPEELYQSQEELWFGHIHPDDMNSVRKAYSELMEQEKSFDVEYRIQHKDGRWIWINDHGIHQEGAINAFGSFSDITCKKESEIKISWDQELSKALINEMPFIAMLIRPGTREIVASNKHAEVIGAKPGKICFKTFGQRQDPCPSCLASEVWKTGKKQHLEIDLKGIIWDTHWSSINDDLYLYYAFDITERKKEKEKLKESEYLLDSILKNMPVLLYRVDKDGFFTLSRGAGLSRLGLKEHQAVGLNVFEAYASYAHYFTKALAGETLHYEEQGLVNDELWAFLTYLFPDKITGSGTIGFAIDITDHMIAEQKLQQSEAEFRMLFEKAPTPIFEVDLSEVTKGLDYPNEQELKNFLSDKPRIMQDLAKKVRVLDGNNAFLELMDINSIDEFSLQELGSQRIGDTDQNRFPFLKKILLSSIKGETSTEAEIIINSMKGRKIIAINKASVVPGYEQNLGRVLSTLTDITEIREAEEKIKQSEEKLRNILENSIDAIILIDEVGTVLEWNSAMTQLTNIEYEDAIGKPFWQTYQHLLPLNLIQDSDNILSNINNVLKTGKAFWLKRPIDTEITVAGTTRYMQFIAFPIKSIIGFKLGFIYRDTTQHRTFEIKQNQELLKFKIDDQAVYVVNETSPVISIEAFKDLLKIGYYGLIISRTPEKDYRALVDESYKFLWLAEATIEKEFSSLFEKIRATLESLPPKSAVLFDSLDFLITRFGFRETLKFIDMLREHAFLLGIIIIIPLDETIITEKQILLLEKETNNLESRVLSKIPPELLEILQYVYKCNNLGTRPSYTIIGNDLDISKVTTRKRIKQLITIGLLRENQIGRRKIVELTIKGLGFFMQK